MRRWLLIGMIGLAGAASVVCKAKMTAPDTGGAAGTGGSGSTSDCGSLTIKDPPPAVGERLVSGTTTTLKQGGNYLLPDGTLRLTGTGSGSVDLRVTTGSTRANAPFTITFTSSTAANPDPDFLIFEPFQVSPESVTMTLCKP